jgi:hypothetical protein
MWPLTRWERFWPAWYGARGATRDSPPCGLPPRAHRNEPKAHRTEPDVKIVGLRTWVHCREFESSDDYWDGNWLRVTARCEADGAVVEESEPPLHLGR